MRAGRRVLGWAARSIAMLVLATGSGWVGCAAQAQPVVGTPAAGSGPGEVYLALGDSVAAGIGATRPGEGGYAAILAEYLGRQLGRPVQPLFLASPGETTTTLLAGGQLTRAVRWIEAARRSGSQVGPITLTIGANDLLGAGPDPTARDAALRRVGENLGAILTRLQAATKDGDGRPGADLVVTGYYDPTGTPAGLDGTEGWWLARLDDVIEREALRVGARWVDVAAVFRDRGAELTWYPSDIHPTNAGHRTIADAIWRALGYDRDPPAIRIDRPVGGALTRFVPTVAATVEDRVGVTEVAFTVDGAAAGPLPFLPELGAYGAPWDARAVAPGWHAIEVWARDAAGNEARARIEVEVPSRPQAGTSATPSAAGLGLGITGSAPRAG